MALLLNKVNISGVIFIVNVYKKSKKALASKIITLGATCLLIPYSFSAESFVVQNIQIKGLQRITDKTVRSYLPIHEGDYLNDTISEKIIEHLYQTGLFEDVQISHQGQSLILSVIERSTISRIQITGNKQIKKEDIQKLLTDAGVKVGSVYDRSAINMVQQSLQNQYNQMSYFNAKVDVSAQAIGNDTVALKIAITENSPAKIRKIEIIGNHAFSTFRLLRQLSITTPKLWTFITKTDQYSEQKLDASKEALQDFYMNHGYLRFKINSAEATLTPDQKNVQVVFNITEGDQYHFSGFKFSGRLILPEDQLKKQVKFRAGDLFSKRVLQESNEGLGTVLGDQGYAFAQIEPVPVIDDQKKQVFINFIVSPGKQVYVRRIQFAGNTVTADYVLRHAVQQMEGGLISVSKVKESIRQLNLLGYFKNVQVKSTPVSGTNNQVDLDYLVEETNAGTASVNFGYSTLTKFEIGAGINQPNFMGTGRTVGLNFSRNSYLSSYALNYFNPFFTATGIGFGASFTYQKTRPTALNISNYTMDNYGATFYYTIPLSLNDNMQLGYGFNRIHLGANFDPSTGSVSPTEVQDFINRYGSDFEQVILDANWTHNSQDKAIFPTEGLLTSLGGDVAVPAFGNSVKYYKLSSRFNYLLPLERKHEWIISMSGGVAYGSGYDGQAGLPFFANYYAGGLSQGEVLGYESASLGPRDSNGQPIGGNFLVHGRAALIFPNYISDSIRTSVFMDAGNVYQTNHYLKNFDSEGSGPMRYSAGVGLTFRLPMGPITISLAQPVHMQARDNRQIFQFTMDTSI